MKLPTLRVLIWSALAIVQAHAEERAPSSIAGTWSGKDEKGVIGAFVFGADGAADVLKDGVSLKEAVVKDRGSITYRFDPSVSPIALDIVVSVNGGPVLTMQGIVEFLSADKMRVRLPPSGPRPKDFAGPENEMIVVERPSGKKK